MEWSGGSRSTELWNSDRQTLYFASFSPSLDPAFDDFCAPARPSPYVRWGIKRLLDIIVASGALLFFLPVVVLIAIALYLEDGKPLLFRQARVGRNGKLFGCLKFRTMARDADARLQELLATDPATREEWTLKQKLLNDPRVHGVGSVLRRSSLDELPQLINILRGEMSLVGPRPILPEQAELHGDALSAYSSVRPGLTGLWQVSGRNELSYAGRVALDLKYLSELSATTDLRILLKTFKVVLIGTGV
jgi:exopolysaccharide production protein ExoY